MTRKKLGENQVVSHQFYFPSFLSRAVLNARAEGLWIRPLPWTTPHGTLPTNPIVKNLSQGREGTWLSPRNSLVWHTKMLQRWGFSIYVTQEPGLHKLGIERVESLAGGCPVDTAAVDGGGAPGGGRGDRRRGTYLPYRGDLAAGESPAVQLQTNHIAATYTHVHIHTHTQKHAYRW